ncbi:Acylphosphatase-domain-containing protein [Dioszegia hungarica]|uniref:acylphosphatase n=1 Tax=Dioszegia hungarica TaxID=4972 RepID=A0AA38HDC8_9TREE|nr:Acylphosphatase-domain-containing protein [Dioszegia hungarica]KAI9638406.1 Acylphosphatase-domain-containing protein [Dioszegia hungarica]
MVAQDLIHFKGVSFRYFTQKQATKLGLKGWVSNKPDESVQGVAVGSSEKLADFRKHIEQGPSAAKVDKVELLNHEQGVSDEAVRKSIGNVAGFEIR